MSPAVSNNNTNTDTNNNSRGLLKYQQYQERGGGSGSNSGRRIYRSSESTSTPPSVLRQTNSQKPIKLLPILQQASSTTEKPLSNKPSSSNLSSSSLGLGLGSNKPLVEPKIIKFSNLVNLESIKNPYENDTNEIINNKHSSLDGKEKQVALTMREKKELKQLEHFQYMEKLKEYSEDIKTTRKGDAFDIESNRYISRKNELQKEMDQLTFEMKKFVYDQTITKNTINGNMVTNQELSDKQKYKIKQMMKEEYRQQGKDVSSLNEKAKYVNYKEFKQEKQQELKMERIETREMIKNGILDKKQLRKKRLMDQQRKNSQMRKFYAKHGAPNEVGVAAIKSKYGKGGAVGKWKGGMLHIRKEDLYKLK